MRERKESEPKDFYYHHHVDVTAVATEATPPEECKNIPKQDPSTLHELHKSVYA